jgi:DNA helicase-2/ATP-dependent DNA helicase PcrA
LGQARTYGQSLLALLRDEERLQEIGVINREAATLIPKLIETARSKEITLPPHRVLEYLLQASGLLDFVMIHDPLEGTRVLRRLFDEVENLVMEKNIRSLAAIAEIFAARRSYNLPMTAPYIVASTEAVHVMTAHKAKGLEFTEVFIPYLQDTSWGGGTKRTYFSIPLGTLKVTDTFDMFDDERRLLYVALTRAKERLHLSCADASNARAVLQPSRLFEEIDPATITVCATDTENATFNPLIDLTQPTFAPSIDLTFLTKVLATRGFSATSLNNYLSNPWDYVYRNVLRIPEVQSTHLQFGTVIHAVLEFATKYHTSEGRLPSATMAKAKLEQALGHLPLSQTEFMRLLERGLVVLYPYFDHLARVLPAQTKEELRIKVLLKTGIPELPELPLSGTLDRLDIGADGRTIHVVDYKTGKPKTRNVIEGKTKSGDGAYKRQLVFYALLLSLYDDDRYRTRTGVLSFVEPDTTGQVKEETFIVTDADIIQLQTEIITATQSILHGTFLTDQVAAQASQYAHLIRQL